MFTVLNLISGFLEIGCVLYGMSCLGVSGALIGALCYQLGNLVPHPLSLSRACCLLLTAVAACCGVLGFFLPGVLLAGMPCLTMVLQNERAYFKTGQADALAVSASKVVKRGMRVIGFALGFALTPVSALVCTAVVLFALCFQKEYPKCALSLPRLKRLDMILVLHEIHYFVYCYCALLIAYGGFVRLGGRRTSLLALAAFAFAVSWIPYVFAPNLYKKPQNLARRGYRKTFMLGHGILALFLTALLAIAYYQGRMSVPCFVVTFLSVWFFTGLGGTTEFCIEDLDKKQVTYEKNAHNTAENFGHIAGVLLSMALCGLTRTLWVSLAAAVFFVLAAFFCMAVFVKEE